MIEINVSDSEVIEINFNDNIFDIFDYIVGNSTYVKLGMQICTYSDTDNNEYSSTIDLTLSKGNTSIIIEFTDEKLNCIQVCNDDIDNIPNIISINKNTIKDRLNIMSMLLNRSSEYDLYYAKHNEYYEAIGIFTNTDNSSNKDYIYTLCNITSKDTSNFIQRSSYSINRCINNKIVEYKIKDDKDDNDTYSL